jgi:uncharacterized membrane protein YhaH (DUF805 family)
MFKTYFGEWGTGKLQRLPYLGYYVLMIVLVMAIIFAGIFATGMTENIIGGDIVKTQEMLFSKFGTVAVIGIVVLMFMAMLGQVNILGKRIRDMGLPVLWTILGIIVISLLLNIAFPPQEIAMNASTVQTANGSSAAVAASVTSANMVVQIFDMVVFLCLLFIPSNAFGSKNSY